MGPFIAQNIQKTSSPRGFGLIFLGLFYYQFQPIAMICTFLERGESYLTYNQSFIKSADQMRDLWDHLSPKLFKKIRVREALV